MLLSIKTRYEVFAEHLPTCNVVTTFEQTRCCCHWFRRVICILDPLLFLITRLNFNYMSLGIVYRSKTIRSTYSHKQIHFHILVTVFGNLFSNIRPKTCGLKIKSNHTNTPLPIKVKLILVVIKMSERSQPLHKYSKYKN